MKSVLIIENSPSDFNNLSENFKKFGWNVIPDNFNKIAKFFNEKEKDNLKIYIEDILKDSYREIGVIILDIELLGSKTHDTFGLVEILPVIRDFKGDFNNWGLHVPVIAYSHYTGYEHKKKALGDFKYHVHSYFCKVTNKVEDLLLTAEALYSVFSITILDKGVQEYVNDSFKTLYDHIQKSTTNISDKIDKLGMLYIDNTKEMKDMLNILLAGTIRVMDNKQQKMFLKEFSIQLKKSGYSIDKLNNEYKKPLLINKFKNAFSNGTFNVVLEHLFHICMVAEVFSKDESNIFPIIIGYALLALSKVLSKC